MSIQINCLLRTANYRGDHSADVAIAISVEPGETVESLVKRLLVHTEKTIGELIELRLAVNTAP